MQCGDKTANKISLCGYLDGLFMTVETMQTPSDVFSLYAGRDDNVPIFCGTAERMHAFIEGWDARGQWQVKNCNCQKGGAKEEI